VGGVVSEVQATGLNRNKYRAEGLPFALGKLAPPRSTNVKLSTRQ
jgi:hypothetical protein